MLERLFKKLLVKGITDTRGNGETILTDLTHLKEMGPLYFKLLERHYLGKGTSVTGTIHLVDLYKVPPNSKEEETPGVPLERVWEWYSWTTSRRSTSGVHTPRGDTDIRNPQRVRV